MRISRAIMVVGVVAMLPSCDVSLPSGPGQDRAVAELHGRDVAPAWAGAEIRWSPSGDQVTFVSPDHRTAYAHNVATGVTRSLYRADTGAVYDAQLSADGVEYFTASAELSNRFIRQHSSAGATVLTEGGGGFGAGRTLSMLVASTQAAAAFVVSPDQLFLVRRGSESRLINSGCQGILAFSPDDSRVLCAVGNGGVTGPFAIFHLDNGAMEPVVLPADIERVTVLLHWDANGIKVLYYPLGGKRLSLYDQTTGSSRALMSAVAYPESGPEYRVVWSKDGRKVAYWNSYCARSSGLFSCDVSQDLLYVLDVASGTSRRIAVHTPAASFYYDSSSPQLAFSPSGSTIAYAIDGRLYLVDVN